MKKNYIEPKIVVEDFSVDEMVAATCDLGPSDINVVAQMGDPTTYEKPCTFEQARPLPGESTEEWQRRVTAYNNISEGYEEYDHDNDPLTTAVSLFTSGYASHSTMPGQREYICSLDPFKNGITLTESYICNSDQTDNGSSILINS